MTRLAIVERDTCKPKDCAHECEKFCPVNLTGKECIIISEENRIAEISEILCNGCGICVRKCPFDAIKIINLPEQLDTQITHRYGKNQFKLHRLPVPRQGKVIGLVGQNGAGKSTSLEILSGSLIPNLGSYETKVTWDDVLLHYKGTELYNYFKPIVDKNYRVAVKPQKVERLPKAIKGKVKDLVKKVDERGVADEVKHEFSLAPVWDQSVKTLSGGELQRLAIAATYMKESDAYFFDEPSNFLDIKERLRVSKLIKSLVDGNKIVVVVEHDLTILDYLSNLIHLYYGTPGAYGVVTYPMSIREGINVFLDGYIPVENMKFRDSPIIYHKSTLKSNLMENVDPLITYGDFEMEYDTFKLQTRGGSLYQGDIVGIVGPNGTGKTTFAEIIAGKVEPKTQSSPPILHRKRMINPDDEFDEEQELLLDISYKPQYLEALSTSDLTLENILTRANPVSTSSSFFKTELIKPLGITKILYRNLNSLSGGELQRAAIAQALVKEADLYLIDEPSAYISAEDRVTVAKVIKRIIKHRKAAGIIIEHDLMLQVSLSDRIIHFDGHSGISGQATEPMSVQDGMNHFLEKQAITFRADKKSGRPRVNKLNSKLDKMQKVNGNYFNIR